MKQEKIDPVCFVPMDLFAGEEPMRVELAYAGAASFCGIIYRSGARLWLHEDLAAIVLMAARLAWARHDCRLIVYDGLRTVTAQEAMLETPIVRAHPQWLAPESRVLSPPGYGGHPRGMAVDVSLETADGVLLDMGTAFDALPVDGSGPDVNRAHRGFADLPDDVRQHRAWLDQAMADAAEHFKKPLLPLPVEWWDFRFPSSYTDRYAPLADADLPPQMRMTSRNLAHAEPGDFPLAHFEIQKRKLLEQLPQSL